MTEREFITRIESGEFTRNDIISEAGKFPDVVSLVEDMELESLAINVVGIDTRQAERIDEAVRIIEGTVGHKQRIANDVYEPRYKEIAQMFNDGIRDGGDCVIKYMQGEIEHNETLFGDGVDFVDYVYKRLSIGDGLGIWGRGSHLLNREMVGNIFERLTELRSSLLSIIDKKRPKEPQQNGNVSDTPKHKGTRGWLHIEKAVKDLPIDLTTEKANKWLERAKNKGFVDSDYRLTDKIKTKPQMALLAEILKDKIGLRTYVPFEKLWGVEGIAKQRSRTINEYGKVYGGDIIERAFDC